MCIKGLANGALSKQTPTSPTIFLLKELGSIINVPLFRFPTSITPNHCKAETVSLQSTYSITAKRIQYHCKVHTVSLQSAYSITAKLIQYHCRAHTVSLQSIFSITAKHIQQLCKQYAAVTQSIYSNIAIQMRHYITLVSQILFFRS